MKQKLLSLKAMLVLLIALSIGVKSFAQGVILSESFDATAFPPTGWKINPTLAGAQLWSRNNGTGAIAQPHTGAADASFRKTGGANPVLTQNLVTPAFDLSGIGSNTASMSFWMFNDTNFVASLDSMIVWMNTSDTLLGATRIGAVGRYSAAGNAWNQHTFNYPSTFNGTTNYIIFQGIADAANTRRIYLDDVNWETYPPLCSGSPNVGSIVKSLGVICGGSGSANLSLTSPITNASGISYQWKAATSSTGSWSNVGTNSTYNTGTISSTMYYECVVTCSAGGTYTTNTDSVVVSSSAAPIVTVSPTVGTACPGTTVPVTATTAGGTGSINYSWSPATGLNTTTGAIVNASATIGQTNIYVVTATDLNGCTDTAQVRINASNAPNKQAIAILNGGKDSVCTGVTLILRAGPGGGGPGGGNTFSWSNGKTSRNDTISPTASGLYVVTVTSAASGCSTNDSINITLLPGTAPTVTITPSATSFCTGGTPITLTASGTTATYTWTQSNNGGLVSNSGSPVQASPTAGGGPGGNAATYTVTASASGCTNTATVTITVGSAPVLNPTAYPMTGNFALPSDTVCTGTMIRLNSIPGGGNNPWTYVWSDGSTHRIDTITATVSKTYKVTATSTCGSTVDSIMLVVNSKPQGAFSYSGTGLTISFSNTTTGATGYSWSFGDGTSSTNASPSCTYAATGSYTVTLIAFGTTCGNDTIHQTINVTGGTIGINEVNNALQLNAYPNPTNENATVSFVMNASKAQLSLINALGQTVSSKAIFAKSNNNFTEKVSLAGLPNGVYFVQVKNDKTVSTIRLIKE